jgi:glycosyltransferase involved in cell wall biosynthesis
MAQALVSQGIEVTIATTDDDGPGRRANVPLGELVMHPSGARCFYFRKSTEFYKISLAMVRWLRQHITEFDVIHIHALFSFSSIAAARIARRRGVPYIVRPLGVLNRWGMENRRRLLKQLSLRFLDLPALRGAASIHFTSRAEMNEAAAAEARIERMPSAIIPLPVASVPPSRDGDAHFFDRFPQARAREIILFLSRIDAKKGVELLIDAFKIVRADIPGALLVIAGGGEPAYTQSLRERAMSLGVMDDVIWAGFLDGADKSGAFQAATVFVLPSYSENFGIAAAEALAYGVPSVISNEVAISEDIREADAGIVVPCDVAAIATALCRLLREPATRARLASNARELVSRQYSGQAVGQALVALYQSVSRKGPAFP